MPDFKGPGQWRTQAEEAQRGVARDPDEAAGTEEESEAETPADLFAAGGALIREVSEEG